MQTLRTYCILFFMMLLGGLDVCAQKFTGDPAAFPTEVSAMMALSQNQECIDAGARFSSAWPIFSASQQKKVIEVSQKLVKSKKLRTNPHYRDFYSLLASMQTQGMGVKMDTFLIIVDKVTDTYIAKQLEDLFRTSRLLVEERYLYKSSFNTLKVEGGTFNFRMIEAKQVMLPDELPVQEDTAQNLFSDWDNYDQNQETWSTIEDTGTVTEESVLDAGYTPPPQPAIEGPVIEITGATFVIATPYDTVQLKNTSGSVLLRNGLYVGKGGTFDWSSAGLSQVYCDLAEYNFPIRGYKITSEGSRLHYASQTDSIPIGVFEFNSMKYKNAHDKNFPRFKSFYSNIPVKGLDDNIRYHGGFSLSGRKIYSSSLDEGYATIEILKAGEVRIKAVSNRFHLGDSLITADYSKMVIYQGKDSIYHPGVVFRYNKNQNYLRLTKTTGFRMAPFIDSYHKIEITADALLWHLDTDKIQFNITNARNEVPALFESQEFFEMEKYAQLKGLYQFHPLQMIVAYADKIQSDEFPVSELAEANKIQESTLRGAMTQLMKLGFIDYNVRSGMIIIKEKARHYVLARRNKKDYDNINFVSIAPSGANAELDLTSNSLIVHGVKRVYISDSLAVNIEPDSNTIEILQNRDFKFNGKINTANFQFQGTDFVFNYDSFYVKMPSINAIKLAVTNDSTLNKEGKARVLGNELRYSSGTLYINKPDNKSARKKFPEYPIFDASTGASVFFNKEHIANGAYDTTMQFKIPPFRVDSLSSDDPSAIGFDGTFESGGIFPAFEEKLVVMPDYSLGFTHDVPTEGYQLYQGDGKYYSTLRLDNQGLRGNGEIHYLNTTLWSSDFVYFKDSTLAVGSRMVTKPGTNPILLPTVTFPDVTVENYRLHWKPKLDSMYISNIDKAFELYNQTAGLQGTLNVTHGGMYGMGILTTRGSESESMQFHFEEKRFGARNATFRIKSDNTSKPALKSVQAKLEFDLEKGIATFGPEQEGFASTEFPYAQYKTSLEKGVWDLEKRKVFLTAPDTSHIDRSYFYSTHPQQDSLVFNATNAVYLIDSLTLNIYGIPYIKVNDGRVYPDSNRAVIHENAVMQTLNNAVIKMDSINNYHHLYDGNIDIYGRKKFNGEALYRYVNLGADTLQIHFTNFQYTENEQKKKTGGYTVAIAEVKQEDTLYVGDKILYKGKVTMYSPNKFLAFDGYIKLDLKGALSYSSWLKYSNSGESNTVTLDLQNPTSEKGNPLVTSLSWDIKSNQLYPNFISEKVHPEDKDLLVVSGAFQYNADSLEFGVGDASRLKGRSFKGNYLSYNDNKSTIKYGGRFTLGAEHPSVTVLASGMGEGNLTASEFHFNYMLGFIFKGNTAPLVGMGTNMGTVAQIIPDTTSYDPNELQRKQDELYYKLAEFIDNSGIESYKAKKALGPVPLATLNSDFEKAILFSEVNMKWSVEYKAFYSVGDINVSNFLKTNINKKMKGYIEVRKTPGGDIISIYLEPAYGTWYYISYEDNRLALLASSEEVNTIISGKTKGEMPDRTKFFVVKAEPMEMNKFVNGFKERYGLATDKVLTPDPQTQDSTSTGGQKVIQLEDTDNTNLNQGQPGIYQDSTANPNQYKIQEQNTNYQGETDPNAPANKPTLEQQQQLYLEQQQLKNLFK